MIARIYFVVAAYCFVSVTAFAPTLLSTKKDIGNEMTRPIFNLQQAHVVPSCTRVSKTTFRSLSSTEPEPDATKTTAQSSDGTYYDDEVNHEHSYRIVVLDQKANGQINQHQSLCLTTAIPKYTL
jgi:hypothetical protein